jgi:hypothetical protein
MTSSTKRRRLSKAELDASNAAWEAGRFSDEWLPFRRLAANEAGIIMPPDGTAGDQWNDDHPTQRAELIRAIRETPNALRAAIQAPGVHSWAAVIAVLLRGRDQLAEDIDAAEEREIQRHRAAQPTRDEATEALRSILRRLGSEQ